MIIRQATARDAENLLSYLSAFWTDGCDTVLQRSSLPNVEEERKWLSERDGKTGIVFVAEQNKRIVGAIDASIPSADEFRHTCEFGMSVLQEFRKQGIGKRLLQRLLEWAEESGLWKIELNVFSTNSSAIMLYSSLGFTEDGRRENAVKLKDSTFCDLVHMARYTETANHGLQQKMRGP